MTPEAQRIAIAEACGWRWCQVVGEPGRHDWQLQKERQRSGVLSPETPWQVTYRVADAPDDSGGINLRLVPDYLNDRDALHEVLGTLTPRQKEVFVDFLEGREGPPPPDDAYIGYVEYPAEAIFDVFVNAPLEALVKALLQTFGKWGEGK